MQWKKFKASLRYMRAPMGKQYRLIMNEFKKENYYVSKNRKFKNIYIHNTIYFFLMLISVINNEIPLEQDEKPKELFKNYNNTAIRNILIGSIIYCDVNVNGKISHPYLRELLQEYDCNEYDFMYSDDAEINSILDIDAKLANFYFETIVTLIHCDLEDKKIYLKKSILAFLQFNTINQRTNKIKVINKYDDVEKYEKNIKLIELQVSYMKIFTKSLKSLLGSDFSYLIDFINYKSRKLY